MNRRRSRTSAAASAAGAALIAAASGLHLVWAAGSAWPARDRRELADLVAGAPEFPDAKACLTVATLLAAAAGIVAWRVEGTAGRASRAGVAGVFAVRGFAGLTGSTTRLVPWTPSARFVELDRRYYGPLCLAIAALTAADLPRGDRRGA